MPESKPTPKIPSILVIHLNYLSEGFINDENITYFNKNWEPIAYLRDENAKHQ